MRVRVWGCRGSVAAPGAETVRYGGNTSCVEVRLEDGTVVILDAGTGIRPLGLQLEADPPAAVHVLLSHLHLDHLVGLGFFAPLFSSKAEVHVWGPRSPLATLEERIARYLSPPLFPVRLADVPSTLHLHDVHDEAFSIGSATVLGDAVTHQGPTLGYRIEEAGRTLAYIPDHEPALGIDLRRLEPEWISGYRVAHDANVLFHDAQYTADEHRERLGWGHSSIEHAVQLAQRSRVERLILFHHDPLHSDDDLEAMERDAQRLWGPFGTRPHLAYEGMEFEVAAGAGAERGRETG